MLTSLPSVRSYMQYQSSVTTDDASLSALIPPIDQFIKGFCGWNIERVGACISPTLGSPALASGGYLLSGQAYFWAITAINPNGETTPSNEVTLTPSGGNLSATLVWSPVASATGYNVYRGTATGAENALVATLSPLVYSWTDTGVPGNSETPPAVSTATAGFTEYLNGNNQSEILLSNTPVVVSDLTAVYLDPSGAWGQGTSSGNTPFAATTLLVSGADYALKVDQADGVTCKSGILVRLNGVWPGQAVRSRGQLAVPVERSRGSIKVNYQGGYRQVPWVLQNIANMMIARLMAADSGFVFNSESFEDRSVGIDLGPWSNLLLTPEIVSQLLQFRKIRA